jgi:hypothetical protein
MDAGDQKGWSVRRLNRRQKIHKKRPDLSGLFFALAFCPGTDVEDDEPVELQRRRKVVVVADEDS